MKEVFIASARRTAIGGLNGSLSGLSAPELGGAAISSALEDSGVEYNAVSEVIMGCVLPAGLGQAPARQAGFHAGLGKSIPATTINKMCGSGMKAVMLGHDQIKAGEADIVIAGGMESMSNAPYLTSKLREGEHCMACNARSYRQVMAVNLICLGKHQCRRPVRN